jgi:hypothetical protein
LLFKLNLVVLQPENLMAKVTDQMFLKMLQFSPKLVCLQFFYTIVFLKRIVCVTLIFETGKTVCWEDAFFENTWLRK